MQFFKTHMHKRGKIATYLIILEKCMCMLEKCQVTLLIGFFFFFLVGYFGTALLDALPPTLAYHHSPIFSDQVFLDI